MEVGGKAKNSKTRPSDKPYARSGSLFGRVSESVRDMLSPSWLVDLVSSVKKKTPPPGTQHHEEAPQQGNYTALNNSRPLPDIALNSPSRVSPPMPHSNEFSMQKMFLNEANEFTPVATTSYAQSRPHLEHQPQLHTPLAGPRYFTEGAAEIQQLRQTLRGSVTPSHEIEERAQLQTQMSQSESQPASAKAAEPSFLWANETTKRLVQNEPQPPAKRHKPSFNASVFGSSAGFSFSNSNDTSAQPGSNSFHNSTYYSGKTTFGGSASTPNRVRRVTSYSTTPKRTQVTVRKATASREGVTSSAAKKILDCLDRMSTPLTDVKKIPSFNSSAADSPLSFSPGIFRRRSIRHGLNKHGPPVSNLSTPTQASIGRNLQRPSTSADMHRVAMRHAGGAAPASFATPLSTASVQDTGARQGGKMKRERSTFHQVMRHSEADDEETPVVLPTSFTLPVSGNLPKFDFATTSQNASAQNERPVFITSSPIGGGTSTDTDLSLPPAFTFSSPIAEARKEPTLAADTVQKTFKFRSPITLDGTAPSSAFDKPPTSKAATSTAAPLANFAFKPSTSLQQQKPAVEKRPALWQQSANEQKTKEPVHFKSGSVMDVLGGGGSSSIAQVPLSSLFKTKNAATWSCPTCMVANSDTHEKCPCCETAKPGPKVAPAAVEASASKPPPPRIDSDKPPLSSLFARGTGWSCPGCFVSNSASADKCPCCETSKPGAAPAVFAAAATSSVPAGNSQMSSQPRLSSLFKKPTGNWDCDTCMVSNKSDASKCIACEGPRASLKDTSSFTSPGGFSSSLSSSMTKKPEPASSVKQPSGGGGFKFTASAAASSSDNKSDSGFKFTTPAASATNNKVDSNFGFGTPTAAADKSTAKSASNFAFTFKSGASDTQGAATDDCNSKVASTNATDKAPPAFGGFQFAASSTSASDAKNAKPSSGDNQGLLNSGDGQAAFSLKAAQSSTVSSDNNSEQPTSSLFAELKPAADAGKAAATMTTTSGFALSQPAVDAPKPEATPSQPSAAASGSGIFGMVATEAKISSAPSLFGNVVSSSAAAIPAKTAAASSLFAFSSTTVDKPAATAVKPTGGFSFAPKADSTVSSSASPFSFGPKSDSAVSSTAGGFSFATKSAATASAGSADTPKVAGFSFSSNASSTVAPAAATTGFGGFAASTQSAAPKIDITKPAADLFMFGKPAATGGSDVSKPLGATTKAQAPGGFNFSAGGVSTAAGAPATNTNGSSNLFVFGSTAPATATGLKRGHAVNPNDKDAKKAATFGSAMFGQGPGQPAAPSGFGSSAFPSATSNGPSAFGASTAQPSVQPVFGNSSVFGGAQSQPPAAAGNGGFNFASGGQPAPANNGGFNFNAQQQTAAPAFGGAPTQPAPASTTGGFNFSAAQPSFNFGAAAQPSANNFQFSAQPTSTNMFNATAGSVSSTARRPIKKAVRRTKPPK